MTTAPPAADPMPDAPASKDRSDGLLMRFIAGSVAGAALTMLFAPGTVRDLRKRAAD